MGGTGGKAREEEDGQLATVGEVAGRQLWRTRHVGRGSVGAVPRGGNRGPRGRAWRARGGSANIGPPARSAAVTGWLATRGAVTLGGRLAGLGCRRALAGGDSRGVQASHL